MRCFFKAAGCALLLSTPVLGQVTVSADLETQPAPSFGPSLVDVALWVHPEEGPKSLIFAADQLSGGLFSYQLDGGVLEQVPNASVAVDVRQNLRGLLGFDALLAVLRVSGELDFFEVVLPGRTLRRVNARPLSTGLVPVGLTFLRGAQPDRLSVYAAGGGGRLQEWRVTADGGTADAQLVRDLTLNDSLVDLASDDAYGTLWAASSLSNGVWSVGPDAGPAVLPLNPPDGGFFLLPVRSLALYEGANGRGHWVVSHGEDTFSVFSRVPPHAFQGNFKMVADGGIDGVSLSEGVFASSASLGQRFPKGIFLALDGLNDTAPNVKGVSWETLSSRFSPPLEAGGTDGGTPDGGATDAGRGNGGLLPGGGFQADTEEKNVGCHCRSVSPGDGWLPGVMAFWAWGQGRRNRGPRRPLPGAHLQ